MGYFVSCNKCLRKFTQFSLNELEREELEKEGSFVCSDCINIEMKGGKGV